MPLTTKMNIHTLTTNKELMITLDNAWNSQDWDDLFGIIVEYAIRDSSMLLFLLTILKMKGNLSQLIPLVMSGFQFGFLLMSVIKKL
jgi:hypothetical protein